MKLAVVGSREGADLGHVEGFVLELPADVVLVSGGAEGVDSTAEAAWLSRGGQVISFRATRFPDLEGEEVYGVERWELGAQPRVEKLLDHPTFADYKSALYYRDMLIAAESDRLVAFMRQGGSRGSQMTAGFSRTEGHPTFEFETGET